MPISIEPLRLTAGKTLRLTFARLPAEYSGVVLPGETVRATVRRWHDGSAESEAGYVLHLRQPVRVGLSVYRIALLLSPTQLELAAPSLRLGLTDISEIA
jgi:hypothetical protein